MIGATTNAAGHRVLIDGSEGPAHAGHSVATTATTAATTTGRSSAARSARVAASPAALDWSRGHWNAHARVNWKLRRDGVADKAHGSAREESVALRRRQVNLCGQDSAKESGKEQRCPVWENLSGGPTPYTRRVLSVTDIINQIIRSRRVISYAP